MTAPIFGLDVPCRYCRGTGARTDRRYVGRRVEITRVSCLACGGGGYVRVAPAPDVATLHGRASDPQGARP